MLVMVLGCVCTSQPVVPTAQEWATSHCDMYSTGMASSHASFKFRVVLPFCYQFTQVVLEKRPLKGCSNSSSSGSVSVYLLSGGT